MRITDGCYRSTPLFLERLISVSDTSDAPLKVQVWSHQELCDSEHLRFLFSFIWHQEQSFFSQLGNFIKREESEHTAFGNSCSVWVPVQDQTPRRPSLWRRWLSFPSSSKVGRGERERERGYSQLLWKDDFEKNQEMPCVSGVTAWFTIWRNLVLTLNLIIQ